MQSLSSGLIAYWTLHGASGTRYSHNNLLNLTDNNTVTGAGGRVVLASQFVSANTEYLSRADEVALRGGDTAYSLSCWVYMDTIIDTGFMTKESGGSNRDFMLNYRVADNAFRFSVFVNGATQQNVLASTFGIPSTSTWCFLVAMHDPTTQTFYIQVNNTVLESNTYTGTVGVGATPAEFCIGRRASGVDYANGRICEAGKWDRLLTNQERTFIFNNGNGLTYPFDGRPFQTSLGRRSHHRRPRYTGVIGGMG